MADNGAAPERPFSICVYCGSRSGGQADYAEAAAAIGRLIGERGARLVYGGGRVGLMGVVADAALAAGARVVGVIPRSLMEREVGHGGLSELHVVETMHERKRMMAEQADAFIALPGGIGTFEELFEVWTWRQLGYHDQPIGLLNTAGYYDALLAFMRQTGRDGFVSGETLAMLEISDDPAVLLDRIEAQARSANAPDDYRLT